MRITDLKVDGFGVWSGLELPDLSDQLNVFYGPNEAGKTTLMQFVRSVLYGFSPERRGKYLPPVRPGRPGGSIQAVADETSYAVSRHADEAGDVIDVTAHVNGQPLLNDERLLHELLGDIDEPTFNNVFAFGLREIQELGTLSDIRAAEELYSLALGLDRVSLVDVLSELEASRNRLLAADDRPSLVTQLLGQRQRLQSEIDELAQATSRYLALSAERDKLDEETARLEAECASLEKQARELGIARTLGESWRRRAEIDRQLQSAANFEALPDDALARFDRLEARLSARRRGFQRLKEQRRALRAQIEQLKINDALCRNALRLEALIEQRPWLEALENQITELTGELRELEGHRDSGQAELGIAPVPGRRAEPLSKQRLEELRQSARLLRDARRDVRPLRQQVTTAHEAVAKEQQKIDSALGAAKAQGLTEAVAAAGERVSLLRARVQVDERLDQMSRREAELNEQSQEQPDGPMLSGWVLAGLGCFFALGCGLVLLFLAGMAMPASLSASLGWPYMIGGVAVAGVAGGAKLALERRAVGQLDTSRQQSQSLSQQIKQAKAQRDELDAQLPRGGGPLVSRLQTAEKELVSLEALLPLEAQRETAERSAAAIAAREESLVAACRQRQKEWQRLLASVGLPANLSPAKLRDFARRSHQLRGQNRSIEQKTEELKRRRAEYETLALRVTQLVAEVGVTPVSKRPADQLQQCLAELTEQRTRQKRRRELSRQMARLRRRKNKLTQLSDRLRRGRHALLNAAGTTDPDEFRRRVRSQAEAGRLRLERTQLAHEIATTLSSHYTEEQLAARLASATNLEELELELMLAREAATKQLNDSLVRRGEMNQQLKAMIEDRQLGHKRIELGIVEKRLQDALDRWRVLTICGMMLEAVRQYYEREHQPQALREASVYLQRLTGGRYTRVWTPLGQHALRVDDGQGNTLSVEVLSRGTREQLFLALRLALVSSYARRGVSLPLVLDDVLVNFDVGRAKAAAAVLRDFAKLGHQILIFTCHEHVSKLFKQIKAEVRQLPDNASLQEPAAEEQPARRARRPRMEPEVQDEPLPELDESYVEPTEPKAIVPPTPVAPAVPVAPPVAIKPPVAQPVPQLPVALPPVAFFPPRPRVLLPPLPLLASPPPAPPVARAVEPPPVPVPPPPPKPARPAPARVLRRPRRVDWSAEEFDGELADRVRMIEGFNEPRRDVDEEAA
jgi:uncharacterized protein YhaN